MINIPNKTQYNKILGNINVINIENGKTDKSQGNKCQGPCACKCKKKSQDMDNLKVRN